MNRRDLLKWLGVAPVAAALPVVAVKPVADEIRYWDGRKLSEVPVEPPPNTEQIRRFTADLNKEFVRENLFKPYRDDAVVRLMRERRGRFKS